MTLTHLINYYIYRHQITLHMRLENVLICVKISQKMPIQVKVQLPTED